MTQQEAALKWSISGPTLSNYENNARSNKHSTIVKLAFRIGLDPDKLKSLVPGIEEFLKVETDQVRAEIATQVDREEIIVPTNVDRPVNVNYKTISLTKPRNEEFTGLPESLGEHIEMYRLEQGWNLTMAAEQLELGTAHVHFFETHKRVPRSKKYIKQWADRIGLDAEYLWYLVHKDKLEEPEASFGVAVRNARLRQHMEVRDAEEKWGVDGSTLSRVENNIVIPSEAENINKWSERTGVDVDTLTKLANETRKQVFTRSIYKNDPKSKGVVSGTGGIDLNSADKTLEVKNGSGSIQFKIDPAMLKELQNAPGFVPVIISVQPLTDLPQFLGINP